MTRDLINKIYNSSKLTDSLLDEVKKDIELMNEFITKKAPYRELIILIDSAKMQKNMIVRQNYKFLILSNLEKRYKRLIESEMTQ